MNKELKKFIDSIKSKGDYGQIGNGCCILLTEYVNALIEAIEKQDELIDYLRRSCERKDENIISMRDENTEQEIKVEQQEKMIDLMLDEIANNIANICPLEDYDYDLDCENKCNDNYKECWKQYFENKAKEVR